MVNGPPPIRVSGERLVSPPPPPPKIKVINVESEPQRDSNECGGLLWFLLGWLF